MRPPILHRQLDVCDVCEKEIHRHKLVRTQVRFVNPEANNYALYSTYNTGFWTSDATDGGTISISDGFARCRIADDNTVTEIKGAQTWTDAGTIVSNTAVDGSSFSRVTFACDVGPYHRSEGPTLTVVIGVCDDGKSTVYGSRTFTTKGHQQVWYSATISSLTTAGATSSALYFFITVTPSSSDYAYWFADRFHIEADTSRPGTFTPTKGTAVAHSADSAVMTVAKVCPECRERLLNTSDVGKPRREVEAPIPVDVQEV